MYVLTTVVTATALLVYLGFALNVAKARKTYGVKAPAITGNEQFERIYRVQMNTLEQLVVFIPALWLFAFYAKDIYASMIGLIWIIGRILYAKAYYTGSTDRSKMFMVSFITGIVLLLGAVICAVLKG